MTLPVSRIMISSANLNVSTGTICQSFACESESGIKTHKS